MSERAGRGRARVAACIVMAAAAVPGQAAAGGASDPSGSRHLRELDRRMLAEPLGGGPAWTEIPPPEPIDHGPFARYAPVVLPVADLDADGRQDLYTFERSELGLHAEARSGATGASLFSISESGSSIGLPDVRRYALAHDLVGDDAPDLILFRVTTVSDWVSGAGPSGVLDQRLTVYDGRNGSEAWSRQVTGTEVNVALRETWVARDVIADVDVWSDAQEDGLFIQRCHATPPSVVECTGEVLRASDGTTVSSAPFTTSPPWYLPEIEPVGDLDGDGSPDILLSIAAWPSRIVAADRNGTRLWSRTVHGWGARARATARLDLGAGSDLIVETYDAGWRTEGIDGATGATRWVLTHGADGSLAVAGDHDADGVDDLLRIDPAQGSMVADARSGADGRVLWSRAFERHRFQHHLRDLDGDGLTDAVLRLCAPPGYCGSEEMVAIAGRDGATMWTTTDPRRWLSVLGGDVNRNGSTDLARWSAGGMSIIDGRDLREIRPPEATPLSWWYGDRVYVVDVTGGFERDLLINARTGRGRTVGAYGVSGEIWRLTYAR